MGNLAPLSLRLGMMSVVSRATFKQALRHASNHKLLRKILDGLMIATAAPSLMFTAKQINLAGVAAEEVTRRGAGPTERVLYYLHGGAFLFGSARTHRALAGDIAHRIGAKAVVPNYRLAPEHPFPAAFEDSLTGYKALLDRGVAAENIVLAGDSAGGCLTLALLDHLGQVNLPMPACAITLSALSDMSGLNASLQSHAASEAVLVSERFPEVNAHYLQGQSHEDRRASPILGDYTNAPPILMQVAAKEVLYDDTRLMFDLLRRQGADVQSTVYAGGFHVFQILRYLVPEAQGALREIATFAKTHLTSLPTDS